MGRLADRTLGGFRWRYAGASRRGIWLSFHKYSSQLPIPCQMPELLSLFIAIYRYSRGSEEFVRAGTRFGFAKAEAQLARGESTITRPITHPIANLPPACKIRVANGG